MHEISILQELRDKKIERVAKIVDQGKTSGGSPIIDSTSEVHEFVVLQKLGLSLRDFYEEISLSLKLKDVVKIGIALITQIEKLHEAGIIHCDIKPDNIMLAYYHGYMQDLIEQ